MVWCGEVCRVGCVALGARLCCGVVVMQLVGVAIVLGHGGAGVGRDGGPVVVLVVPCPLAPHEWWSWHGPDICGQSCSCVGRRVRPVRRLVMWGVRGGLVWVWGGGPSLSRVGCGDRFSLGGRWRGDSWCSVSAGASQSIGCWGLPRGASVALSRGGGERGRCGGSTAGGGGGRGCVLRWLGVWASSLVVWVLSVLAVRSLRSLAAHGAEVRVGGGRMGIRAGLWSVGSRWLLVDGACWYGLLVGGLLVVVGGCY